MRPILYGFWRSSATWRVRWALAVKRVPFDYVPVDLIGGEQRSDRIRALNPLALIPALIVDGRALAESVAIVEWLEETHPAPPLYPRDPWARARVRQIVELVNASVQPMQNGAVYRQHSDDPEEQLRWSRHFIARGVVALEALLGQIAAEGLGGRFAVGDSLTAADLFLVPQLTNARRHQIDLAPYPRLLAAETAAIATEHAAAARPESQPDARR